MAKIGLIAVDQPGTQSEYPTEPGEERPPAA
jgi:hypothetical protein